MKHITLLFSLVLFITFSVSAQFKKPVTVRATAAAIIPLNGLATNDFGLGAGIDASFFSQHRLQAIVETGADLFVGDKLLRYDSANNRTNGQASAYTLKAGLQFFLTKRFAIAASAGSSWWLVRTFSHTASLVHSQSITGFLGRNRRFITKLSSEILPIARISYLKLSLGFRF